MTEEFKGSIPFDALAEFYHEWANEITEKKQQLDEIQNRGANIGHPTVRIALVVVAEREKDLRRLQAFIEANSDEAAGKLEPNKFDDSHTES